MNTVSVIAGDPPQAAAWIGQCILYLLIMVFEKAVISLVLLIPGWTKVRKKHAAFVEGGDCWCISCCCLTSSGLKGMIHVSIKITWRVQGLHHFGLQEGVSFLKCNILAHSK